MKGTDELKAAGVSIRQGKTLRIKSDGITNIGLFRKYVELYLKAHPRINKEQKLMAKLLEPTANGIPLQIYVFTNIIDVVEYENTVAHIFEHLIAVIPEFGLRLFQNPAGNDLKKTAGAD
jgi:miniconductance mechanosensitive channel